MSLDYSRFDNIEEDNDEADSAAPSSQHQQRPPSQPCIDDQEALVERCNYLLSAFAKDEQLQQALRHPSVIRAINHWTGRARLSSEEANTLMDSENLEWKQLIQPAFNKIRVLQEACGKASLPVPIDDVFAGKSKITPPPAAAIAPPTPEEKPPATDWATMERDLEERELGPEMTAAELGEHVGRRVSSVVVMIAVMLYLVRPPEGSPFYAIPGMMTLLPPR